MKPNAVSYCTLDNALQQHHNTLANNWSYQRSNNGCYNAQQHAALSKSAGGIGVAGGVGMDIKTSPAATLTSPQQQTPHHKSQFTSQLPNHHQHQSPPQHPLQSRPLQAQPQRQHHQNQHQHNNHQQQQHHHHHYGNTFTPAAPHSIQKDIALTQNYAKLPATAVDQQRINECAGIPLISNVSLHLASAQRQRVLRKSISFSPSHTTYRQHSASEAPTQTRQISRNSTCNWSTVQIPISAPYSSIQQHSPNTIVQLAAHAQGMPLMLSKQPQHQRQQHQQASTQQQYNFQSPPSSPRWPNSNASSSSLPSHLIHNTTNNCVPASHAANSFFYAAASSTYKSDKSRTLRYQNSAPAALNARTKDSNTTSTQSALTASKCDTSQSHKSGQTSETKDLNETCLPRIIKPRKRRKKDRKPSNGIFIKLDAEVEQKLNQTAMSAAFTKSHKSTDDLLNALNSYSAFVQISNDANYPKECLLREEKAKHFNSAETFCPFLDDRGALETLVPEKRESYHSQVGVCFCEACDPLRCLWDYPLRRSLSDSSAATASSDKSSSSSTSSTLSSSSSSSSSSAASSSHSPPFSDATNFQNRTYIRTDDSFSPVTVARSRAEIVGVIGSNRTNHESGAITDGSGTSANVTASAADTFNAMMPNTNSLGSALNSSLPINGINTGYANILSGINIASDLFNHTTTNNSSCNADDTTTKSLTAEYSTLSPCNSLQLLPETAETLLSESINEISRKLIETCGNELNEPSSARTDAMPNYNFEDAKINIDLADISCKNLIAELDHLNISNSGTTTAATITKTSTPTTNIDGNNHINFDKSLTFPASVNMNFFISPPYLDMNNNFNKEFLTQQLVSDKHLLLEQRRQQQQQLHEEQLFSNCFDFIWQNALAENATNRKEFLSEGGGIGGRGAAAKLGEIKTTFSTIS